MNQLLLEHKDLTMPELEPNEPAMLRQWVERYRRACRTLPVLYPLGGRGNAVMDSLLLNPISGTIPVLLTHEPGRVSVSISKDGHGGDCVTSTTESRDYLPLLTAGIFSAVSCARPNISYTDLAVPGVYWKVRDGLSIHKHSHHHKNFALLALAFLENNGFQFSRETILHELQQMNVGNLEPYNELLLSELPMIQKIQRYANLFASFLLSGLYVGGLDISPHGVLLIHPTMGRPDKDAETLRANLVDFADRFSVCLVVGCHYASIAESRESQITPFAIDGYAFTSHEPEARFAELSNTLRSFGIDERGMDILQCLSVLDGRKIFHANMKKNMIPLLRFVLEREIDEDLLMQYLTDFRGGRLIRYHEEGGMRVNPTIRGVFSHHVFTSQPKQAGDILDKAIEYFTTLKEASPQRSFPSFLGYCDLVIGGLRKKLDNLH